MGPAECTCQIVPSHPGSRISGLVRLAEIIISVKESKVKAIIVIQFEIDFCIDIVKEDIKGL